MNHICIDLETLSTRSNAAIVTIAGVKFSFENNDVETFCVNVNPYEGSQLGLHVSQSTIDWWRSQKPEAVDAWKNSRIGIVDALTQFNEFCGDGSKKKKFWSNGSAFDFPILDSSYFVSDLTPPYEYWNICDMRTAYYLANFDYKAAPRIGVYHNALDDCLTQIAHLKQCVGAT
jgi:hypothetical protein